MGDKITISVTNQLTGEISEIEIAKPHDAAVELERLLASEKAIKRAITQIKDYIDAVMGNDDVARYGNLEFQRVQRETRTWTVEGLREIGFDEDAIAVISKVNMTAAKELVNEAIERGEISPHAKKMLNESAEVKVTKPYITTRSLI